MPIFSFAPKVRGAGLALTDSMAALVCLSRKKQIFTLENYAMTQLPAGIIASGKILQAEELIACIADLVRQCNAHHWPAATALSATQSIRKIISMPACLSDEQRETEIQENTSHYFPGIDQTLCCDHAVIQKSAADNDDVLVVAAREEDVRLAAMVATLAGLNIISVGIDIFARMQIFSMAHAHEKIFILVEPDSQAQTAHCIVLSESQPLLMQNIVMDNAENFANSLKNFLAHVVINNEPALRVFLAGNLDAITPDYINAIESSGWPVAVINPVHSFHIAGRIDNEKLQNDASYLLTATGLAAGIAS